MIAEASSPLLASATPESAVARLADYRVPSVSRSVWQLCSTLAGFVLCWALAWFSLRHSYLLTLLLAVPTAGFLVRLFILAHDCGHGSFFRSKQANDIVGSLLGVFTLTPYSRWRKQHAIHHATSGNLDRRGIGDVHMLTVREYEQRTPRQQWAYRVYRHPLVLFGIGPLLYFVVLQRLTFEPRTWKKERRSVHLTNLAMAASVVGMCWWLGWASFLLVHAPTVVFASSAGVWLFYVQHHYEAAYWRHQEQWDYVAAGLAGSSYYVLPRWLAWFTADIGLHHIHHVDSHIPNYRLAACFHDHPQLQQALRLTIRESLRCARLKLWDEESGKMVGFDRHEGSANQ